MLTAQVPTKSTSMTRLSNFVPNKMHSTRKLRLLFFSLFFSGLADAGQIEKVIVVTPVYRELRNGNILRHIEAFAALENPQKLELSMVLIVNDLASADEAVQEENQRTLYLLEYLAGTRILAPSDITPTLKRLGQKLRERNIHLDVLDYTGLPHEKPNIGEVRALAHSHVFKKLKSAFDQHHSVLVQMDADTLPEEGLLRTLPRAYADDHVDYVLFDLEMTADSASPRQISAHLIRGQLLSAQSTLTRVFRDLKPPSGTPRITARLSAMIEVGGFSPIDYAEDQDLISKFRRNNLTGLYLPHRRNRTQFRGREDGYDAKANLQRMNDKVEVTYTTKLDFFASMSVIDLLGMYFPSFYQEHLRFEKILFERRDREVVKRRAAVIKLARGGTLSDDEKKDAFLRNEWLGPELRNKFKSYVITPENEREQLILKSLERDFASQIAIEVPYIQAVVLQFEAATRTLYSFKKFISHLGHSTEALRRQTAIPQMSIDEISEQWILNWLQSAIDFYVLAPDNHFNAVEFEVKMSFFGQLAKQFGLSDLKFAIDDVFRLFLIGGEVFERQDSPEENYEKVHRAYARLSAQLEKIESAGPGRLEGLDQFKKKIWAKLLAAQQLLNLNQRKRRPLLPLSSCEAAI